MANQRTKCWYSDDPDPAMRQFCRRNVSNGRALGDDEKLVHKECEAALPGMLRAQEFEQLESQDFWLGLGLGDNPSTRSRYRDLTIPSDDSLPPQSATEAPPSFDVPPSTLKRIPLGVALGDTGEAALEVPDASLDPAELMVADREESGHDVAHEPWTDSQTFRDSRLRGRVLSGFPPTRISDEERLSLQTVRHVTGEERLLLRGFRDLWIRFLGSYCSPGAIVEIFGNTITAQHVRRIQRAPVSEWELGILAALKVMFPEPHTEAAEAMYPLIAHLIRAIHCDEWAHRGTRDDANHERILNQVKDSYEHFASREPPL